MSNRDKALVSCHRALDEAYTTKVERPGSIFDVLVQGSVNDGDIDSDLPAETIHQNIRDEYLRDTSVTVVSVGAETWQQKHIGREIGSWTRQTVCNSRSGLLGILLPAHQRTDTSKDDPHTSARNRAKQPNHCREALGETRARSAWTD